jgi:hypothetical protein
MISVDPIIQSLPSHLANFASGQLATAHLYSPTRTIDPDILISLIIEESERHNHKDVRNSHTNNKPRDGDEVLSVAPGDFSGRGHGNSRGGRRGGNPNWRGRQRPPCWNCGSREHFKADCTQPPSDKSADSKAVIVRGSAHLAADIDSEDEGVFALDSLMDLPDLLSLSSDDDDEECASFIVDDDDNWFSEVDEDEEPLLSEPANLTCEVAASVADAAANVLVVELYDSGSTRHISPYRNRFESLTTIPPKSFVAANKQCFDATWIGEMVIEIPNGVEMSQLRLTEVLFSPEVGYTLVSIGCLNELGYSTTFANGWCTLQDPSGDVIGRIPKTNRGLYHVIHIPDGEGTNAALETVTIMELHRRMGHIAPSAARRCGERSTASQVYRDSTTFYLLPFSG